VRIVIALINNQSINQVVVCKSICYSISPKEAMVVLTFWRLVAANLTTGCLLGSLKNPRPSKVLLLATTFTK